MKYKWDNEQVMAIKESIKHWQFNVNTLRKWDEKGMGIYCSKSIHCWFNDKDEKIFFSEEKCSLCQTYICKKCPLSKIGQQCDVGGSAWSKCYRAVGNKEIITAAENMLRVLEGLLE